MTWALDHAADLSRKAAARLAEGRPDVAAAMFVRAFDTLESPGARIPGSEDLRLRILEGLHAATAKTGDPSALVPRLAMMATAAVRLAFVPSLVRKLAVDLARDDGDAVGIYLAALESRRPLDRPTLAAVLRILARALRIRSRSEPEEVQDLVPKIERLLACRPGLDFPRLYLARYHHAVEQWGRARQLLLGIRGPMKTDIKVLNLLGRCAEKLNRPEEAVAAYERSLRQREAQGLIHFRLGRLLLGAR